MGCCEGKDFRHEQTRLPHQPIEELAAISQRFLLGDNDEHSLARKVKELSEKHDWGAVANYFCCREKLLPEHADAISQAVSAIESVGELALYLALQASKANPNIAEELVKQHALQLLTNLGSSEPQLACFSLSLLHLAMKTPCDSKLQSTLVSLGIFEAVLPLYNSSCQRIRSLASHVCPQVFGGDSMSKKKFMDLGGHKAIAQLVVRDGDDENILFDLMEDILDLLYVREYTGQ